MCYTSGAFDFTPGFCWSSYCWCLSFLVWCLIFLNVLCAIYLFLWAILCMQIVFVSCIQVDAMFSIFAYLNNFTADVCELFHCRRIFSPIPDYRELPNHDYWCRESWGLNSCTEHVPPTRKSDCFPPFVIICSLFTLSN